MKVSQMASTRTGNPVANQFILKGTFNGGQELGMLHCSEVFQSYNSIIAVKATGQVYLDKTYWDYSRTTSKYRNKFLGMTTPEIKANIKAGDIKLVDLNQ